MGEETLAADVTRGSRRGLYPVRWNLAVENLIVALVSALRYADDIAITV